MWINKNIVFNKILNNIGTKLVEEAKLRMLEPSTGRRYNIKGKVHVASRPYHSPNILSRKLYDSVRYENVDNNTIVFGAGDSNIPYAKYLEDGTRKMLPRPFVNISFLASLQKLYTIFEVALTKTFKLKFKTNKGSFVKKAYTTSNFKSTGKGTFRI